MLFEKKTNELFSNRYDVGDMLRQETHSVSPTVSKPHSLSPTASLSLRIFNSENSLRNRNTNRMRFLLRKGINSIYLTYKR
jgi:hypothetical protein